MKLKITTLLLALATPAFAVVVTDWQGFTSTTATGILNGVTVTSTIVNVGAGNAAHIGIQNDIFDSSWEAPFPLTLGTETIGVQPIRAGTQQSFTFSSPVSGLRFYIDNFDESSAATITVTGATAITLAGASTSFVFNSLTASTAQLTTTNTGFSGESDGILEFTGAVTQVELNYSAGNGNNFVTYTFAVPEPTSAAMLVCGAALILRRRTLHTAERGA